MDQLFDCAWPAEALLADPDGPYKQARDLYRITQLAEPYAPVWGTKFLPKQPYHMIAEGSLKPNSKLVMNYVRKGSSFFKGYLTFNIIRVSFASLA